MFTIGQTLRLRWFHLLSKFIMVLKIITVILISQITHWKPTWFVIFIYKLTLKKQNVPAYGWNDCYTCTLYVDETSLYMYIICGWNSVIHVHYMWMKQYYTCTLYVDETLLYMYIICGWNIVIHVHCMWMKHCYTCILYVDETVLIYMYIICGWNFVIHVYCMWMKQC